MKSHFPPVRIVMMLQIRYEMGREDLKKMDHFYAVGKDVSTIFREKYAESH